MDKEAFLLDNQLCFRLYTAARLTMVAYHPYLAPLGITYPQYLVMLVLWEKDERPVCDIGKRLLLETNTLTPILQRMEKAGLVIRTRGKEDTRQRIVSLTEKGHAMRQQAAVIHKSMRKEVALKLSEEKEMFPMLDKFIEELQKLNK